MRGLQQLPRFLHCEPQSPVLDMANQMIVHQHDAIREQPACIGQICLHEVKWLPQRKEMYWGVKVADHYA